MPLLDTRSENLDETDHVTPGALLLLEPASTAADAVPPPALRFGAPGNRPWAPSDILATAVRTISVEIVSWAR